MTTPLHALLDHGQSYWLDNLTRTMVRSGELKRRVEEEGLRGMTSNPSIFSKAISSGDAYDEAIRGLVADGRDVAGIYEGLVVEDIQEACDVLRPVWEESEGVDGFVSLEVSPHLARDTDGSVTEARRLHAAVDRPNVMIKIPGTEEGIPAIETLLVEGVPVNITLLFSVDRYVEVARTYLRALETRRERGLPLPPVASVASFFLSRIDVKVDALLGHRMAARDSRAPELLGRAGIAWARRAYQRFEEIFQGPRWEELAADGARPQRLLWASTSTKDPLYSDVRYVDALIGPHTVTTLPDATVEAFADHGTVERTVDREVEASEAELRELGELGIDLERVAVELEDEGIRKFVDPYDDLMASLARRRRAIPGADGVHLDLAMGLLAGPTDDVLDALTLRRFADRLARKDGRLWSLDPDEIRTVEERLGWLDLPASDTDAGELSQLADEVRDDGIRRVVLLGMGGSSLGAEVGRDILPLAEGAPRLEILDDTDPASIRALDAELDPATTLWIVASKSGTTAETLSLYRHAWERTRAAVGDEGAGRHFVAVTDPGTPLAREGRDRGFRRVFENRPDIGGRYSVLSHFGLVPLALAGADVEALLDGAARTARSCGGEVPESAHPGVRLGAALGVAARAGRDKLTVLAGNELAPLGTWLEQLVAESTGKEGKGILPVTHEPAGDPDGYADDRVFLHLAWARADEGGEEESAGPWDDLARALGERGHPVLRVHLDGPEELGGAFFLLEVATATAGAVLGIDPFDQPDVEAAKANAREILEAGGAATTHPWGDPVSAGDEMDGIEVYLPPGAPWAEGGDDPLRQLLGTVEEGDYVALLPFMRATHARREPLQALRRTLRGRTGVATTLGWGPRYLHSTGQLHKGGPDDGVFLLVTSPEDDDLPIPGDDHGFATLHRAQALGDLRALADRGRRVAHLHLTGPAHEGLETLKEVL